jgi:NDP-sugar pyrophosphorylase family protein
MALPIVLLTAGLGTRLRPLTDGLPKALVPLGGTTFLEDLVARLRGHGSDVRALNAHHAPRELEEAADKLGIVVSLETPRLLGTAGGVRRMREAVGGGEVIAYGGDIYAPTLGLAGFAVTEGAMATLVVEPRGAGEGNVGLDADGRIVRLRGESFGREVRGGYYLAICALSAGTVLPDEGCLVADVWLPMLRRGAGSLTAVPFEGAWIDVGSIRGYVQANHEWLTMRGVDGFVHPSAQVCARTERSIVGRGARIDASCMDAIVWPGAVVSTPAARSIVTKVVRVPFDA